MKGSQFSNDLLVNVSENDPVAFRKLYDLLYLRIFRFSGYFVRSVQLKEEIVSDVFFSLWQNRKTLPTIENLEAYAYTIARNRALYYLKQKKAEFLEFDTLPPVGVHVDGTPETEVIAKELKLAIEKAINELPDRCRLIFLMAKEEGLKYREIAEILEISEKTVNAQIVTAIKKLGDSLRKLVVLFFTF